MKLNLGCGFGPKQGYVNVDCVEYQGVDEVVDLNILPWPWEDNSVEEVYCSDVLEHLCPLGRAAGQLNIIAVLGEIHRVLKPDGLLEVIVPTTDGPGAFQDPTHVTYWNKNTFMYFLDKGGYSMHVPGVDRYPKFSVTARDLGIADSSVDQYGVVWTCARLRKVGETEPVLEGAVEGADVNG